MLTIVIPTRNRRSLLERALGSALSQTDEDYEVVVVDDASTDSTADFLQSVEKRRLRVVNRATRGGVSAARNAGISTARGPLISFVDDDDEVGPSFVARTRATIDGGRESLGFCWSWIRWEDHDEGSVGEVKWDVECCPEFNPTAYLHVGTGFGLTVRRECFDDVGLFDESLTAGVDFDLLIRLGQKYRWAVIPEVLVTVHRHGGPQVTDPTPERASSYIRILEKHKEFFREHPEVDRRFRRKTAILLYRLGDPRRGRRVLWEGLKRRPVSLPLWKTLLAMERRAAGYGRGEDWGGVGGGDVED